MPETTEEIKITYNISNVKIIQNVYKTDVFDFLNGILCIIIIIVNFLVVFSTGVLLKRGQQPRAAYIYLGNISLSDMIVGILNLFISLYPHQFQNEILCSLSIGLTVTASLSSIISIGLIAIDRYLYILYGLHYHRYITTNHSPSVITLTWFVSAVLGIVPIFILRRPMGEQTCWFIILVPAKFSLILVSMGIFQMGLIIVLNSIILKNALKSMSRIECASVRNFASDMHISRSRAKITAGSGNDDLPSSEVRSIRLLCCPSIIFAMKSTFCKNKWKAVKIVVFTAGAFFITWSPSFVTWILYSFCDSEMDFEYCERLAYVITNPLSLLSLSNSLLNPIIYAWWHQGFRESVKKMYSKLFGKKN